MVLTVLRMIIRLTLEQQYMMEQPLEIEMLKEELVFEEHLPDINSE